MRFIRIVALFLIISLLSRVAAAATVTHGVTTTSTANAATYISGAFTPAAGDLLVAFAVTTGTVSTGVMTDSQALGFTKIASATKVAGDTIYLFISNAMATANSMTVTLDVTGDNATGAVIFVARVAGMSRTASSGSGALRQVAGLSNNAAGTTPAPFFVIYNALTTNPTLGVVGNATNPAGLTPPTNWTEAADTGYITPVTGAEYVFRDSGFTGTTITWGSMSASGFGTMIVELDSSVPSSEPSKGSLLLSGIGR